ncbi:Bgt-20116, partial [Blumeria graminis f. sp. tritici]
SNQEASSSSVAVPKPESLIPKFSGEFPPSTRTEIRAYDNSSSTQIQFFNAPPTAVSNKFLADGTINLYQSMNPKTSGLSDQEMRVKRYFPDIFTRK